MSFLLDLKSIISFSALGLFPTNNIISKRVSLRYKTHVNIMLKPAHKR